MCIIQDCEKKSKCYRHEAKPNPYWQSYFGEDPRKKPEPKTSLTAAVLRSPIEELTYCLYFWPIEEKPKRRPKKHANI